MSRYWHKADFQCRRSMSAFGGKADMASHQMSNGLEQAPCGFASDRWLAPQLTPTVLERADD